MPDFDTLVARHAEAARRQEAAAEAVTQDAAAQRLSYTSPDNMITVVVDGNGNIQDLTIAPGTLHGAHPLLLTTSMRTALNAVRRAALTRKAKLIVQKLEQS